MHKVYSRFLSYCVHYILPLKYIIGVYLLRLKLSSKQLFSYIGHMQLISIAIYETYVKGKREKIEKFEVENPWAWFHERFF